MNTASRRDKNRGGKGEVCLDREPFAQKCPTTPSNTAKPPNRPYPITSGERCGLGHLANTLDTIVRGWIFCTDPILDKPQRKMYAPDFVGGNPITNNPGDYLSWEETGSLYKKVAKATTEELRAFPDEDLPKPLKADIPEQFRELFPTAETTLTRMINHDAYHRGQMALINKLPN